MGTMKNTLNNTLYIFLMGVFLAIIPTFLVERIGFYILPYLIFNVFVYLYYGYKYGKRWPQLSWIIGICLTSPWFLLTYIMLGHYAHGDGLIALQYFIMSGCIYLIFSCIGAYIGARSTRKKELKPGILSVISLDE